VKDVTLDDRSPPYGPIATAAAVTLQEPLALDALAAAIEAGDSRRNDALLAQYIGALGPLGWHEGQIDTMVLGCTHYAFAMDAVQRISGPQVRVLETGEPVARHTQRLLWRRPRCPPHRRPWDGDGPRPRTARSAVVTSR
jgi:glutamate racemase